MTPHNWTTLYGGRIHFKPQNYRYSCVSASYQYLQTNLSAPYVAPSRMNLMPGAHKTITSP